jgi:hypothetical protein
LNCKITRNKFITKNGEAAIIEIEKRFTCLSCYQAPKSIQVFLNEKEKTQEIASSQKGIMLFRQWSISKSFNTIFLIFFIVGIIGAGLSTYFEITNHLKNISIPNQRSLIIDKANFKKTKQTQSIKPSN